LKKYKLDILDETKIRAELAETVSNKLFKMGKGR